MRFRPGATAAQRAAVRALVGAPRARRLTIGDVEVLRLAAGLSPMSASARLAGDPRVGSAEPTHVYTAQATPNDPYFGQQYALNNTGQSGGTPDADIDAPEAWDRIGPSPFAVGSFTVGVVDTGVDTSHPDLSGKIVRCMSAIPGGSGVTPGCTDGDGHGTHVTGIVGAQADNGQGIAGVAPQAKVYACKALDNTGNGIDPDIAACMKDMVDRRASLNLRVISLSLGGKDKSDALEAAVNYAWDRGVLVVAAAGNDYDTSTEYPAGYPNAVSVAATDRNDHHPSFSNANASVELAAPGVGIVSTVPLAASEISSPSRYASVSGTSMSTPEVAGVAALVASRTGKTGASLRNALDSSADDLGPPGRDHEFGFGRVNACRALGGSCGYRGASALRLPITRSFRPTGVRVLAGSYYARRSSVRRLYFNDGSRLELNARRSGSSWRSDLYSGTPIGSSARSTLQRLQVTFNGNVSASAGLRLSVYDWSARRWTSVKLWRRAATSDRSFTWASSSGARRYASVSGQVRLRVTGRRAHSFRTRTDLVRVTATY